MASRWSFRVITLAVAGVSEEVDVVAVSPLVDVKQSSRGFSLRQEQLSLLTPGIDVQKAVPLLPGSNNEPKLSRNGGVSIDGASAAENRFVVDGMNATDINVGLAGYPVSLDAVEELQVKSSGYAAEYGGSTGGVINVITRSGTDAWRADARLYFSGDALEAGPRPTMRRNLQNTSIAEYVTYPEDPYTMFEPAGSIGGPIARGRAWFFGSYQPQLRWQERTGTFNLPYEGTGTYDQRKTTHLFTGSQSTQLEGDLLSGARVSPAASRPRGLRRAARGPESGW